MLPSFPPGRLVIGGGFGSLRVGDVVILRYGGLEKLKRIACIKGSKLYVVGDNLADSTDSRQFGWVDRSAVIARVFWPLSQKALDQELAAQHEAVE